MKKEKPILFSTEMVKAIIAGNKTQTRRVVKPQPLIPVGIGTTEKEYIEINCKYEKGQTLWVRETFKIGNYGHGAEKYYFYKAEDWTLEKQKSWQMAMDKFWPDLLPWKPSLFMPREAARLFLKVTNIRIERIQDISEEDATAEGVDSVSMKEHPRQATMSRRSDFKQLWDSINKKRGYGWDKNPFVWVYDFEVIKP